MKTAWRTEIIFSLASPPRLAIVCRQEDLSLVIPEGLFFRHHYNQSVFRGGTRRAKIEKLWSERASLGPIVEDDFQALLESHGKAQRSPLVRNWVQLFKTLERLK